MRKSFLMSAAAASMMLVASCGGSNQDVADFAADFASRVQSGQVDSLTVIYPGIAAADSLSLAYNPDSLEVTPADAAGLFTCSYGSGKSITVSKDDAGEMKVLDSRGVFYYPPAAIEFARRVGAFKTNANPTDVEMAVIMTNVDNMTSDLFEQYIKSRQKAIQNLGLTVTKDIEFMADEGKGYYTLKNTTAKDIPGNDYTITWKVIYIGMGGEHTSDRVEKGVDIPANGSVCIPISFTGHDFVELKSVTLSAPTKDEFYAGFNPKGNEYEEYLKVAGNSGSGKLGDGPYQIVGKINGKYPIHMFLNAGMKDGYYYYDKSGPGNRLELTVNNFNRNNGKITLEERNAKGEITGTFTGRLTQDTFDGEVSIFNGKTYRFNLTVVR